MSEWLDINEDWCGQEHLFRFEPDLVHGGAYLRDEKGRTWQIRTCAICGVRQKQEVAEGHMLEFVRDVPT